MSAEKICLPSDQNKWGDVLLQPIKWSGHYWSQLTQLKETQPFYKACEALKNLIPLIFVTLAIVFSTPMGLVGSYIKSYDTVSFSLNLSPEISEKLKELGIDHLSDYEIAQKFCNLTRNNTNRFVSGFGGIYKNCEAQFGEKIVPTKLLAFTFPQKSIKFLDIFSRTFRNKCSFDTPKIGELFLRHVLGYSLSSDELKFLPNELSRFSEVSIFIPKQDTTQAIFNLRNA